jgi:delta24(24(1))-sterol reductase
VTGTPEPSREPLEFGGSAGALAIVAGSHLVPYWLWICWSRNGGALWLPEGLLGIGPWLTESWHLVSTGAAPTVEAVALYLGFLAFQALLAVVLPGPRIQGLPIPHQGGRSLTYVCNGIWAWYLTLAVVATAHLTGAFPLSRLQQGFGPLLTTAIVCGDLVAIATFAGAHLTGNAHRLSGHVVYDFFMGAWLNPRLGPLDLKMWAEIRIAWILLFLLTCSAAARQYQVHGVVSTPMLFLVLAHGLYANACHKGEECIPTTWDIFHEKWGWMLVYWNLAGVPFVYCTNAMYLAARPPVEHGLTYTIACFALLLLSYYVWDTAQSQRNRFRMQQRGSFVARRTFPQFSRGTLANPRYLETASGSKLLVDGWWAHARKIHYTADVGMALSWGLICGFDHALPYFYVTFFVGMILHRASRDVARCRAKYGADWDRYCAEVPWMFVPRLF